MTKKVYSFSTRTVDDTELMTKLKEHCRRTGKSFSTIVISAVRKYLEEGNANIK